MRIKKHDKAYIVVLEDGSEWRIWPGDLKTTHIGRQTGTLSFERLETRFVRTFLLITLMGHAYA